MDLPFLGKVKERLLKAKRRKSLINKYEVEVSTEPIDENYDNLGRHKSNS